MAGDWPDLVVVGANHRSAPLALRERLLIDEAEHGAVLARLKAAGFAEALVLSTCDRVEVHAVHGNAGAAAGAVAGVLAERAGLDPAALAPNLYTLEGEAAARHLFAIAASLDSMVIGEPNVLGQVKAAHRAAQAAGTTGGELDGLLQAAYAVAKRVRTETAIGERPVSIAAAACDVARQVHGDLASRAGLVIGVGEMGELVARRLLDDGLGALVVTHRGAARAEALARRLDANVAAFEALPELVAAADVVVACVGLGSYVVTPALMRAALRRRRQRPVFVIDLAVPRDADPATGDLEGVFLYDGGDLEGVARDGLARREAVAGAAWRLVDEGLEGYRRSRVARAAGPALEALRRRFEAARADALADAGAGDAEAATRLLINRLLHEPSESLRRLAADGGAADRAEAERLLRRLFRLDGSIDEEETRE